MSRNGANHGELLTLLERLAVEESQRHWSGVVGLTGDRRFQRQQREVLALLSAMQLRVERLLQRSRDPAWFDEPQRG